MYTWNKPNLSFRDNLFVFWVAYILSRMTNNDSPGRAVSNQMQQQLIGWRIARDLHSIVLCHVY